MSDNNKPMDNLDNYPGELKSELTFRLGSIEMEAIEKDTFANSSEHQSNRGFFCSIMTAD